MSLTSRTLDRLEQQPRWALIVGGIAWTLAIGLLDWLTGTRITLSLFYMPPVAIAAWAGGRKAGLAASVLTAAMWYAADALAVAQWVSAVQLWNVAVRLAFLAILALVVASLHDTLREQHELARRDIQTGLANARELRERAQVELRRLQRVGAPLTLAYCDVDNLKVVNDLMGHEAGDRLLRLVGQAMRDALRSSDTVARMGGDEFALLLADTADSAAYAALVKVQAAVCAAIDAERFEATLSIGAVWSRFPVADVDVLLRQADAALYAVKDSGKDGMLLSAAGRPPDPTTIHRPPLPSPTVRLS